MHPGPTAKLMLSGDKLTLAILRRWIEAAVSRALPTGIPSPRAPSSRSLAICCTFWLRRTYAIVAGAMLVGAAKVFVLRDIAHIEPWPTLDHE